MVFFDMGNRTGLSSERGRFVPGQNGNKDAEQRKMKNAMVLLKSSSIVAINAKGVGQRIKEIGYMNCIDETR